MHYSVKHSLIATIITAKVPALKIELTFAIVALTYSPIKESGPVELDVAANTRVSTKKSLRRRASTVILPETKPIMAMISAALEIATKAPIIAMKICFDFFM